VQADSTVEYSSPFDSIMNTVTKESARLSISVNNGMYQDCTCFSLWLKKACATNSTNLFKPLTVQIMINGLFLKWGSVY